MGGSIKTKNVDSLNWNGSIAAYIFAHFITEYIVTKCKIRLAKAPIKIAIPDSWTKSIYKDC
jgi:hypothetical protein